MHPKPTPLSENPKLRLKLEKFNAIRTKYDSADSFRSHEGEHSVSVSKTRRPEEILTPSSILSGSSRRFIGQLAQSAPHSLASQHNMLNNQQHVPIVHSSHHSSRALTADSGSPSSSDSYSSPHSFDCGHSPTIPRQSRSREISSSHSHSGHSHSHSGAEAEIGLDDGPGAGPKAVVTARSHSSPSPGTSFSPYKRVNSTRTSSGGVENKSRAASASDDFYIVYSFKALMAKNTAQVAEAEAQEVMQREAREKGDGARAHAAATEKREKDRQGGEKKAKRKSLPATLMGRNIFSSSSAQASSVKTNTNSNAHFRPNDMEDYLITPDGPLYTTQPSPNANVPPPSSSGKTRAKRSTSIKITAPSSPHAINNTNNSSNR